MGRDPLDAKIAAATQRLHSAAKFLDRIDDEEMYWTKRGNRPSFIWMRYMRAYNMWLKLVQQRTTREVEADVG